MVSKMVSIGGRKMVRKMVSIVCLCDYEHYSTFKF